VEAIGATWVATGATKGVEATIGAIEENMPPALGARALRAPRFKEKLGTIFVTQY
jgi:hypothetical protein